MSLRKELALKQENHTHDRQFSRIRESEVASWRYFFVESAKIFFISGAEWAKMSEESDTRDMIAWLHHSYDAETGLYKIEIFINTEMFEPPAVQRKFKTRIF